VDRRHAGEVDHPRGLEEAVLELGQEVRSSGQQLRVRPAFTENADDLLDAPGQGKLESSHRWASFRTYGVKSQRSIA
jgi:hypothetical protein